MPRIKRLFFSIRDGGDSTLLDSKGDKIFLDAIGPSLPEGKIIFVRPPFITMTLDLDLHGRIFFQDGGI
jgi:hypothetical protein